MDEWEGGWVESKVEGGGRMGGWVDGWRVEWVE